MCPKCGSDDIRERKNGRKDCRACDRTRRKSFYHSDRQGNARKQLLAFHGISEEDYLAFETEAGGLCLLCGEPPGSRGLFLDHSHATGRRRGLLCQTCNVAIGLLKDSPELLRAAADYIEKRS